MFDKLPEHEDGVSQELLLEMDKSAANRNNSYRYRQSATGIDSQLQV
jgi:hypothetical protein